LHRYVHRTGVGVIGWRQASGVAVAATLAPRDNHRRVVSRGRVVRSVGGYGVVPGGATASASITTADSTVTASAAVSPIATATITTASSTFAGSAAAGSCVASMAVTTDDSFTAAVASVSPVALMGAYTDGAVMAGGASVAGTLYWPIPSQVLLGVQYGPTGVEYTGTATGGSGPTAADIAAAVIALAQTTPIQADLRRVTGQAINGAGTEANPWGP